MRLELGGLALLLSLACTPPGGTDWEGHVREVNQVLVNQGELDRIPEFIAESYIMHTPAGPQTGRHLIHDFIFELRSAFPDLEVDTEILALDGDLVVWKRTHRGTHQGEFMGVAPTGQPVSWQAIVVSRYEDGMVVEEWGASTLGGALLSLVSGAGQDSSSAGPLRTDVSGPGGRR